jgi:integrase
MSFSFYTVATVRDGRKNRRHRPLVLLFLNGQLCVPALRWLTDPRPTWLSQRNPDQQREALAAIGKLFTFHAAMGSPEFASAQGVTRLLRAFYAALWNGTYEKTDDAYHDETQLWWPFIRSETAIHFVRNAVEAFVEYCHANLRHFVFTAEDQKGFINSVLIARQHERTYHNTSPYHFFRHIVKQPSSYRIDTSRRNTLYAELTCSRPRVKPVKKFNIEHIWPLILQGTQDQRITASKPYHQQYDVRDQLMFMFILFGGIRVGALCNLFATDVLPKRNQTLQVRLAHPENAIDNISFQGKPKGIRRQEYLWEQYRLLPRTQQSGKNFAANKYLTYDENNNWDTFLVFAAMPQALAFMFSVYQRYVTYVLPALIAKAPSPHPYFFVNDDGLPIKARNVRDHWQKACQKIGLSGQQSDGQSPHSGRHFAINFIKSDLKLDTASVMEFAKHSDPLSQLVYTAKSADEVQTQINRAMSNLHAGEVSPDNIRLFETFSQIDPMHLFMTDNDLRK